MALEVDKLKRLEHKDSHMIYHEELFRNMESTLGRDTSPDHNMSSKFIHLYA